jgi:hypothetical protein
VCELVKMIEVVVVDGVDQKTKKCGVVGEKVNLG